MYSTLHACDPENETNNFFIVLVSQIPKSVTVFNGKHSTGFSSRRGLDNSSRVVLSNAGTAETGEEMPVPLGSGYCGTLEVACPQERMELPRLMEVAHCAHRAHPSGLEL